MKAAHGVIQPKKTVVDNKQGAQEIIKQKNQWEERLHHLFLLKNWQERNKLKKVHIRRIRHYELNSLIASDVWCLILSWSVHTQSEDVMLQEKGISDGLQYKGLRIRMGWVIVSFQLAQNVYQYTSIEHGLTIHFCDNVLNFLESQTLQNRKQLVTSILWMLSCIIHK